MERNNTLLYVGAAGILGLVAYEYFKSKSATTIPTNTAGAGDLSYATGTGLTAGAPSGVSVPEWLVDWSNSNPQNAPIFNNVIYPQINATDLANLENIVQNYFNAGVAPTPALAAWWYTFINKYGLK